MKLIPDSVTRFGGRTTLRLKANSPTILVVAGVIGMGASAVLAARATRKLDPILDEHKQARASIGYIDMDTVGTNRHSKAIVHLYTKTGYELTKLYGPALFVGTSSAVAVLGGHKILRTRHVATLAAYSGLAEQFSSYRARIVKTLGETAERDIYNGAHGEYVEDPDHKGEYKLQPKYDEVPAEWMEFWFDQGNVNWTQDAFANYAFLKGVQSHMQNLLVANGYLFVNDVLSALGMPKTKDGQVTGWLYGEKGRDNFVDLGFMTNNDPHTVAFRNEHENTVKLRFNVDGNIWALL